MAERTPQLHNSTASHFAQLTRQVREAFSKIINGEWSASDQGRTFVLPFSSEHAKFEASSRRLDRVVNDSDLHISVREDLTITLTHMLDDLNAVHKTLKSLVGQGIMGTIFLPKRAFDIQRWTERIRSLNGEFDQMVEEYTPAVPFVCQPLPNVQRSSNPTRPAPSSPGRLGSAAAALPVRLGAAVPRASADSDVQRNHPSSTTPSSNQPRRTDYRVAWICPVENLELLPSRLMFDTKFDPPPYNTQYDENVYYCGTIAGHNVVMATCPRGITGNVSAGTLSAPLFRTFPNIRMALLVGIGGGVPLPIASSNTLENIHVGDVVVGWPGDGKPACVYFESGRWHPDSFEIKGTIDRPDRGLLNALGKVASDHEMSSSTFKQHISKLETSKHGVRFQRPGREHDRLYRAEYTHRGEYNSGCVSCDPASIVQRPPRTDAHEEELVFHFGRIATGNSVVQDGVRRDQINEMCGGGVKCIEMEAAGVDASHKCLVIRGISDYADSHKDDIWRPYAAGRAAVFARELLSKVPVGAVEEVGRLD